MGNPKKCWKAGWIGIANLTGALFTPSAQPGSTAAAAVHLSTLSSQFRVSASHHDGQLSAGADTRCCNPCGVVESNIVWAMKEHT
jgi:hypothetical protein